MVSNTVQKDRRGVRYRAREVLWARSTLPRVKNCGRARASTASGVQVVVGDGQAHYANLQSCGSVHACPVCAPKIRQERANEIEAGLARHFDSGGGAEFVTLTLRHYRGDDLAALLKLVADGFSWAISGRRWQADRRAFGVTGTIRSLEVTYGANGWHPHLHVLVLTDVPLDDGLRSKLADRLFDRWCKAVNRAGVQAPSREHGLDIRPVTRGGAPVLGAYLQKGDVADDLVLRAGGRRIGLELARADLKDRGEARSPWALLADVSVNGDAEDLALWHEYEAATFRRQSLTWSAGLKRRLLVAEVTDQELVEVVQGGEVVVELSPDAWAVVVRSRGGAAKILEAAEADGAAGVWRCLAGLAPPLAA